MHQVGHRSICSNQGVGAPSRQLRQVQTTLEYYDTKINYTLYSIGLNG